MSQNTDSAEEYLTPAEAGKLFNGKTSEHVARRWVREGLVTFIRTPGPKGRIGIAKSSILRLRELHLKAAND